MNLIYYVNFLGAKLWGKTHLIDQQPDIVYAVVLSSIQFVDVQTVPFIKGFARFAFLTSFDMLCSVKTVNGLGKNTGAGCFSHTSGTAEQKCLSQVTAFNGISQGIGYMLLSDDVIKGRWTVFPRRYYILIHKVRKKGKYNVVFKDRGFIGRKLFLGYGSSLLPS
jgi:hypothetical protein